MTFVSARCGHDRNARGTLARLGLSAAALQGPSLLSCISMRRGDSGVIRGFPAVIVRGLNAIAASGR